MPSSLVRRTVQRPETWLELLRQRAEDQSQDVAFTFLLDGETATAALTYSELDTRARAIAAFLQQRDAVSRPVLIVDDSLAEFITGFFGCLYAGAIPVPVAAPKRRDARRFTAIAARCQPSVILSSARMPHEVGRSSALDSAVRVDVRHVPDDLAVMWLAPIITSGDTAFLQFTSGSTARPRGVVVTHANLLHNQELMCGAFNTGPDSIVLGWLPLHHDMGLIGTVLHPLFLGVRSVLMSPAHFMERPMRWLQAISSHRATISGGPNFAFDLCVRRASATDCDRLDLSCWKVAFNGAEPVRPETLRRFSRTFAAAGFKEETFNPCYGLAEATLFVAGTASRCGATSQVFSRASLETAGVTATGSESPERSVTDVRPRELIAYAVPIGDQQLVVVRPEQPTICAPGEIGEIWLSGPSIAAGYWNEPVETRRVFGQRLDGVAGHFLRTGDLGCVDGQRLFITGRLKDLVIIRGRNIHPEDIEQTVASSHPELRDAFCVAFGLEDDGDDRLVVAREVPRGRRSVNVDEIDTAARLAVAEEHDVQLHTIVCVKPGRLPRTTSGKPQRHRCRTLFLDGTLDALSTSTLGRSPVEQSHTSPREAIPVEPSPHAIEPVLREELGRLLGVDAARVDLGRPAGALGMDSLTSVELQHRLEHRLGVELSDGTILSMSSLSALCAELATRLRTRSPVPASQPREPASGFPLSRGQHALWFLDQLEATNAAVLTRAVQIDGPLNARAFENALHALVQRHDALRTTWVASAGEPMQVVQPFAHMALRIEDAAGWTDDRLHTAVQTFADAPIDLAAGPLVRAAVYRRSNVQHVFALTVHHGIADFWSLGVMIRDLESLYAAERDGSRPTLRSLGAPYRDYVQREAEVLAGGQRAQLLDFWKRDLDGATLTIDLGTDRPRPPVQSLRGAAVPVTLGRSLAADLQAFAAVRETTLFAVMAAAFHALLHRYTGQADLLVGVPVANRPAGWRDTVGYCVNLLPLRATFPSNATFDTIVEQTRTRIRSAVAHQDLPFSTLVEALRPARDPSRHPVVQCTFVLLTDRIFDRPGLAACAAGVEAASLRFADLTLTTLPIEQRSAQFDLSLTLAESEGQLKGRFEYSADLFDAATVQRLSAHWLTLLQRLMSQPTVPIADIPLLTATEHTRLVESASLARRPLVARTVHRLFEAQVRQSPASPIADEEAQVSYAGLNARANQWARVLKRLGVTAEMPVALCTGRSIKMPLGALAILKAGGAYVPLDPSHPPRRIADVLADCAATILVADRRGRAAVPAFVGRVVCLDDDNPLADAEETANLDQAIDPAQAAYVLYTSGSTGVPNGVVVSHEALGNLLQSMRVQPGLGADDRLLAVSTFAFDIAGLELFLPLITGASLVIAGGETIRDGVRLRQQLDTLDITAMQATPATWRMLIDAGWPGKTDLTVLCGGEALTPDLAAKLLSRCAALWNMYGPTETTIWSTTERITNAGARISIGRPIDNTEVHVLDGRLHPVPDGVAGEIFIGGSGLARAYLGRPALTAERFIPHPLTHTPGARLYRTGDRGRRQPDGSLDFLGRTDDQIKLRGFRIELREIERALAEHPSVRQAATALRPDPRGEMMLVGYVVADSAASTGAIPIERVLREHLATVLPAYMIPASIVTLSELPLTPNGKVDRRKLPSAAPTLTLAPTPAQTSVEQSIRDIWRDVLTIDRIGTDDNFFDLGGHSLLLNQVRTQIASVLERDVPLIEFFRRPTIRSLAQYLEGENESADAAAARGLQAATHRRVAVRRQRELKQRRRLTGMVQTPHPAD